MNKSDGSDRPDASRQRPAPDHLARLWAPWRSGYVTGDADSQPPALDEAQDPAAATTGTCVFCNAPAGGSTGDERALVVHRGATVYVVLNAYPYNPGHVMVVPYRHVADLVDLDDGELAEIWALTKTAVAVLGHALSPGGFNVGMNLGRASGAGIADHLHQHVVPRWAGDTNFMTTTGSSTRVLSQALTEVHAVLAPAFGRGQGGPD
ncbi:MAG: HIT domain-containing protein [Nitriliruptoraceae bacterium]